MWMHAQRNRQIPLAKIRSCRQLCVSQKQPGAPRETNPASGYGVSCLASLLSEQALAQGRDSWNLNSS